MIILQVKLPYASLRIMKKYIHFDFFMLLFVQIKAFYRIQDLRGETLSVPKGQKIFHIIKVFRDDF